MLTSTGVTKLTVDKSLGVEAFLFVSTVPYSAIITFVLIALPSAFTSCTLQEKNITFVVEVQKSTTLRLTPKRAPQIYLIDLCRDRVFYSINSGGPTNLNRGQSRWKSVLMSTNFNAVQKVSAYYFFLYIV